MLIVINAQRKRARMVKTFRDRDTERVFKRERVKRFPLQLQKLAQRKLDLLDGAGRGWRPSDTSRKPVGKALRKQAGAVQHQNQ
jgi:hypothetical protein